MRPEPRPRLAVARARLGSPTDGAQRGGAIGRSVRRRNAEPGVSPRRGKTPTAQQCGRRPPQILAARGSPSHWRGRPRVSSSIAHEPFPRRTPNSAELRPPRRRSLSNSAKTQTGGGHARALAGVEGHRAGSGGVGQRRQKTLEHKHLPHRIRQSSSHASSVPGYNPLLRDPPPTRPSALPSEPCAPGHHIAAAQCARRGPSPALHAARAAQRADQPSLRV